ncbi:MAG: M48 family metallopeptidase, partial [Edaphobacter sp.]
MKRRGCLILLSAVMGACSPAAWARFQPVTCKNAFTQQQEITEGQKVVAQVYQQMPVLPDSDPVSRYVRQLGAKLVAHAPGYKWPYNFHVVASEDINAFALPGGTIFVNLGTVQAAETEAQLAGVMAHEISHVVMRHSTCNLTAQQSKSLWYGLGSIASAVLLGNGTAGQLGQAVIGGAQSLDFLHMSRDAEKQADLLGVGILYDSGYDPRGLPQFFETIQAKYGAGGAQFLSDHPNPGNRTEYVNAEIATLPRLDHPVVTTAEFKRVHAVALKEKTLAAKDVQAGTWRK